MQYISLESAFVLHSRHYRETSLLIELFTQNHGRISVIARGVRKSRSALSGLLQPFVPLLITCTGKQELKLLTKAEANGLIKPLKGNALFAGFYLNELLYALLPKWDAQSNLFQLYDETLTLLSLANIESVLRLFEKRLIEILGYTAFSMAGNLPIQPEKYYRFVSEQGFLASDLSGEEINLSQTHLFLGKDLLAIAQELFDQENVLKTAKRLMRMILKTLLGSHLIHSRELFL